MTRCIVVLLVGISVAARNVIAEQRECVAAADLTSRSTETSGMSHGMAMIQRPGRAMQRVSLVFDEADVGSTREVSIAVASYNLYWWNVKKYNRWSELYSRIRTEGPFDLVGFQECEDVAKVLQNSDMPGFEHFQGPFPNPCPIAWNPAVFSKLGEPGSKKVGEDQWGSRWMTWVRLQHRTSGATLLFVNTHGPLNGCTTTLGNNWVDGVNDNWHHGDTVFMTGDYNCGTGSTAMNLLKAVLTNAVDGGIDQILTTGNVLSGGTRPGSPSDHPLVQGEFGIAAAGDGAESVDSGTGNYYRQVSGVGEWGGWCTCPDGQRYNVGDRNDGCQSGPQSLACEGGTPGECVHEVDASRGGMMVTCAAAESQEPATSAPDEDNYRKVSGVGAWGGWCTCPNGQRYNVGDKKDACADGPASLACEGGTPGACIQEVDTNRDGMMVTCGASSSSEETQPASSCQGFNEWPHVDGAVTCGSCRALVLTSPYNRCDEYCESFGHVCVAAAEEVNENCEVKYDASCSQEIVGTSDMLCTCHLPA